MSKITEESDKSLDVSTRGYLRRFAKQMLKNSLFLGVFQEKRFVDSLGSYRDVINICSEEEDFIENLSTVLKKIDQEYIKKPWIGITVPGMVGAPVGYCLWVVLTKEVFGKYWYKVKTVEFLDNEIRLKIDIVRPFHSESSPLRNISSTVGSEFDLRTCLLEMNQQLKENLSYFYQKILTFKNIKHCVIFIFLLITTLITGSISICKYLLEYFLRVMKETSNLIRALTPIIMNCLNLIGKVIFGFYHMIIALFHGKPKPQPIYNSFINIDPQTMQFYDTRQRYNQYFQRGLPYYPPKRDGPAITLLED